MPQKKELSLPYINKIILLVFFIVVHSTTSGHGFGPNTLVQLSNKSHKTIHTLCLELLHNAVTVASCDIQNSCFSNQNIKTGKRSTTNCYIKLGFGTQFNVTDDIVCTPTQEFYVPAYHQWLPAYMLNSGDALLTSNLTAQPVTIKEFVPKSLKIYMLEIEQTHTFFVGKHSILTHNIFLPMAISLGASIPFGSVVAGSIGSFFGTAAIAAGFTFGGLIGVAIKAMYDNQIHRYTMPPYDTASINHYCNILIQKEHEKRQPHGCFEQHIKPALPSQHIFPIEYPSAQTHTGCIEINVHALNNNYTYSYDKTIEQQKVIDQGCFQPTQSVTPSSPSQKPVTKKSQPTVKLTARTWGEFEKNCPIGQQYGKKFVHTGKQNPKDGSPIRKLSEDIPNTEMFKKNYYFAPDRFHDGDHFEVWDKKGNWIGVANLDGSKNEKKTNAEKDKPSRNIKKII